MTTTPPAPLTAERVAQIQARVNAATEGPWEFWHGAHGDPLVAQVGRGPFGAVAMCNTSPADYGQDNARFIAHARSDIPALLAEVERLTAERDHLRTDMGEAVTALSQIVHSAHAGRDEALTKAAAWLTRNFGPSGVGCFSPAPVVADPDVMGGA